jgi:predicted secreted hydrolase
VRRRAALAWLAAAAAFPAGAAAPGGALARYAPVVPGYRIRFPRDEGSHPQFRTEWWYATGWLERERDDPLGFQITFFRTRPRSDERNPSAFTPHEIVIAHAALSDAKRGSLVHDQKIARAALGLAGAKEGDTRVWIDDWSLVHEKTSYRARAPAREFVMDLTFTPAQAPMLHGEAGLSRKGPRPESASYYYSIPQLRVGGTLAEGGRRSAVSGSAWLDHEWSSSYMDERAVGWDWIGINFDDGSALMTFRMRDRTGAKFWAGGSYRARGGEQRVLGSDEVEFIPIETWRSARTGATYPVRWRLKAGDIELAIDPLMADQEHDTRASVGTVYWEGAVTASRGGRVAGRGYLELTGYWQPMKL